jgi:alpha-L-fucosidase 2
MKINNPAVLSLISLALYLNSFNSSAGNDILKIWYSQPADVSISDNGNGWINEPEWLKAFPMGNGSLGIMVYGDVNKERIQLNEKSLWSGGPDDNNNPNAYAALEKIRQLIWDGKFKEAGDLTQKTQICKGTGSGYGGGAMAPYGCFQTLGNLWIDFGKTGTYSHYKRELELNHAVTKITYIRDGVTFTREAFVSYPAQAIIVSFTVDKPGQISFRCNLNRPERYTTYAENNQLVMSGSLYNGKGGDGMKYISRVKALNTGGSVIYGDTTITIKNADKVILVITAATGYRLHFPDYSGNDYKNISLQNLNNAASKPYKTLIEEHIKDFSNYFNRVSLNLLSDYSDTVATDTLLARFKKSQFNAHLYELYFQYGRYLLLSSSRKSSLPANLQGLWTNKIQTPWNCDYHTNINVEMNYWPAEVTNLSECHLQLIDFIKSLEAPGSKTAEIQYHAKGWCIHPITNVWGFTAPGEQSSWGLHLGAGGWLCQHLWEHYSFTLDTAYLKEVFPVMQQSTAFYLDWLTTDPKTGKLVSGPAGSPENSFIAPDSSICQISMGPAHDQEIIWELFTNYIQAAGILNTKNAFVEKVKAAKKNLLVPGIASDGRLMEWDEEFKEKEPGHRHISHLYAVHPGCMITYKSSPELMNAAKKSLEYRLSHGGGHTGWSAAWMINLWARFNDGDKALAALNKVLTNCTAENLFDLHVPFQIDGNFGSTAGIAEMLLQSHEGEIVLLPALPVSWPNGEIKGLCARGGFVVDINWKNGKPVKISVLSENGGLLKLRFKEQLVEMNTKKAERITFNGSLESLTSGITRVIPGGLLQPKKLPD